MDLKARAAQAIAMIEKRPLEHWDKDRVERQVKIVLQSGHHSINISHADQAQVNWLRDELHQAILRMTAEPIEILTLLGPTLVLRKFVNNPA